MSETSKPKTNSKPRPVKAKDVVPLELPTDFSEAISSIERDLNKHRIGTFRVNAKDMSFKWADRSNRELNTIERMTSLHKSMKNGLYRTDIRHRMSGVIARHKLDKRIGAPQNPTQLITSDETRQFNEQAMFPHILFPKNSKNEIEMQSGQHRMAVLRVIFEDKPENWWWIVTLYDQGIIPHRDGADRG
jgi:hypothetical protein